jgi:hypothetical protein
MKENNLLRSGKNNNVSQFLLISRDNNMINDVRL